MEKSANALALTNKRCATHIYVYMEEEPKVGDFYLVKLYGTKNGWQPLGLKLERCKSIKNEFVNSEKDETTRHIKNCKKVVLSTDKLDNVPMLPVEFVGAFGKSPAGHSQSVGVMVEYKGNKPYACSFNTKEKVEPEYTFTLKERNASIKKALVLYDPNILKKHSEETLDDWITKNV